MNFKMGSIFLKFFQSILLLVITILTVSLCYDKPYSVIALLPFIYMIINFFYMNELNKNNKYTGGFIHRIALIFIFIRYGLTPLSIALTDDFYDSYGGYITQTPEESINLAVFLMILELICVYLTLYISRSYYSNRYKSTLPKEVKMLNHKFILIVFALLAISVLIVVEPSLLIPTDLFILSDAFHNAQLDTSYDGIYVIIARIAKPVIFLILFSLLKEKYNLNNNKIYIWMSFLLVVLFIGMHSGTTRWEIIFAGIIGLYLLKKAYGRSIPRILIFAIIFVISISFFSASLYKFSWAVQISTNPIKDITFEMFGMFQDYFSGPRTVANSLEMKNTYEQSIGLSTFINDFIGSIPGVSGLVDQSDRINAYFNAYHNRPNGHTPLIIPMLGVGYSYFILFPPVFTIICYWLVIKFDYKLEMSKSIEYKYVYLYVGLYLAMALGFNTQVIFTTFIQRLLPILLLFKINELICLKKKPQMKRIYYR